MKLRLILPIALLVGATAPAGHAGPAGLPKPSTATVLGLLAPGSSDALAGSIRGYLVQNMPNPLYETWPNWGHTSNARGIRALGPGPHSPKNDGKWKHIRVTADNPGNSLVFDIRNMQQAEPGRITFDVFLAMDARMEYDQQNWQNGVRLWSGGARAKFRAKATLACEVTFRVETGDLLLPEAVVHFRVVRADVGYEKFDLEHINGIGGDLAELIGDALHGGLKRFHPSLERDLLAKANAAIEKAADTKEVRVTLTELLKKKGWWPKFTPKTPPPAPEPEPPPVPPGPPDVN
ncbi:hypothetical protein AYO44_11705 [Planctomycetaceae bacterium SCGC AG-212-F19]|nr:hypothetical protein AYO44_11705 [Planctomycetaceae bacterium SCGC AG-212-F19]